MLASVNQHRRFTKDDNIQRCWFTEYADIFTIIGIASKRAFPLPVALASATFPTLMVSDVATSDLFVFFSKESVWPPAHGQTLFISGFCPHTKATHTIISIDVLTHQQTD